jgi:hypothetical protein
VVRIRATYLIVELQRSKWERDFSRIIQSPHIIKCVVSSYINHIQIVIRCASVFGQCSIYLFFPVCCDHLYMA